MNNQDLAAMREVLKRFEAQVDRLESLLQKQQAGDRPKSIDDQLRIIQERLRIERQKSEFLELQRQIDERSKPEQHQTPWYKSWTWVGAFRAPYAGHTIER